jgi:hypothetical protein
VSETFTGYPSFGRGERVRWPRRDAPAWKRLPRPRPLPSRHVDRRGREPPRPGDAAPIGVIRDHNLYFGRETEAAAERQCRHSADARPLRRGDVDAAKLEPQVSVPAIVETQGGSDPSVAAKPSADVLARAAHEQVQARRGKPLDRAAHRLRREVAQDGEERRRGEQSYQEKAASRRPPRGRRRTARPPRHGRPSHRVT